MTEEKLALNIYSFSYKQANEVPHDPHGGGFVFDCRCLPNPGREETYKYQSGLDQPVVKFLEERDDVQTFFKLISETIELAVKAYLGRKFSSLSVAFGCTGGQHRSVYLSEKLAKYLQGKFDITISVKHLNRVGWLKK